MHMQGGKTKSILVVDDVPICREPIAASLRSEGYDVTCAADGREALVKIQNHIPDLLLLDVGLPQVDGLTLVERMRGRGIWQNLPILLLTAVAEKDYILRAQKLGIQGYLLKSNFSLAQLLARVVQLIGPPTAPAASTVTTATAIPATSAPFEPTAEMKRSNVAAEPAPANASAIAPTIVIHDSVAPLDLVTVMRRLDDVTPGPTLTGVVDQMQAMATNGRAAVTDMIDLVRKDYVLASRVLKIANTAAFTTAKNHICSIDEAVRNIGIDGVARLAASAEVFDRYPPDEPDGFNALRCWAHCFAVGELMSLLAHHSGQADPNQAQAAGLCHELGESIIRQHFSPELAAVTARVAAGMSPLQAQQLMIGMPRARLAAAALTRRGLPEEIVEPIAEFAGEGPFHNRLARLLRVADALATALLLAWGPDGMVTPISAAEARALFGQTMPEIDGNALAADVISETALLAKFPPTDETKLRRPLLERHNARIWYARHDSLSDFDPVETALARLAQVQTFDQLPEALAELSGFDGVVIAVPRRSTKGFGSDDAARACGDLPTLCLHGNDAPPPAVPRLTACRYPVPLSRLAAFINSLSK
jgi:CheY-like chemotaxis protein/HD-like signal output (HDOD) protein